MEGEDKGNRKEGGEEMEAFSNIQGGETHDLVSI